MSLPVIGILGSGYLGSEIAGLEHWPHGSWKSNSKITDSGIDLLEGIHFVWQDRSHWERLPNLSATLIVTVPPVLPDIEAERARLSAWGVWMNRHRPGYRSLVYISTTGVYPSRDGNWKETDDPVADSDKGRLRLTTEKTLADYFSLRVIRPGAIYGPGRNIAERVLAGKPVPSGDQPVHRIHVHDLARIVYLAVTKTGFPSIINAVDHDAAPTRQAAEWLLAQSHLRFPADIKLNFTSDLPTRKKTIPAKNRFISNQLLMDKYHFRFVYPSFREGLLHSLRP